MVERVKSLHNFISRLSGERLDSYQSENVIVVRFDDL